MPIVVTTKALTVPGSGAVSLKLTNPNGSSATGQLKVTATIKVASAKHGGHAKSKTITLGEASFSLAGDGTETVKIVLSKSVRSELTHLKTMHALDRAHQRDRRQTSRRDHLQADPVRSGAQERLRYGQNRGIAETRGDRRQKGEPRV